MLAAALVTFRHFRSAGTSDAQGMCRHNGKVIQEVMTGDTCSVQSRYNVGFRGVVVNGLGIVNRDSHRADLRLQARFRRADKCFQHGRQGIHRLDRLDGPVLAHLVGKRAEFGSEFNSGLRCIL
jgi:hypothetical protein